MFEGVGVQTIIGTAATLGIGVATPLDCYVGLSARSDNPTFNINNPAGALGCQVDFGNVRVFAEHISSPSTGGDYPGVNHAGVKALLPITDDITAYSGVSAAIPSEQLNYAPILMQIGAETGGSVRMYGEFVTSVTSPADGMVTGGVKFVF